MRKFITVNLLALCTIFACATVPISYVDKNGNSITYGPDGVIIKGQIGAGGLTVGTPVKPSGK